MLQVKIIGDAIVGNTLFARTETNEGQSVVGYSWLRGSSRGGKFAVIPLATSDSYTLTPADEHQYIRCKVVCDNNDYAESNTAGPVAPITIGPGR